MDTLPHQWERAFFDLTYPALLPLRASDEATLMFVKAWLDERVIPLLERTERFPYDVKSAVMAASLHRKAAARNRALVELEGVS